ncbi:MAG: hypothetical protein DA405_08900 [Bacteroidetes bacterium]|nr:MAG: hypothetical protein DA405_08900 [Bacteroidota bacterium]
MRVTLKKDLGSSAGLYLLVFSLLVLPLVFVNDILDPCLAPRYSFLGILVFLLAIFSFFQKSWPIPKLGGVFLLFIIIEGISVISSHSPSEAMGPLLRDLLLLGFMLLVFPLATVPRAKFLVARVITVVSLIISAYAIYQLNHFQAWQDGEMLYQVTSFMGHRNLLASAILLSWPWLLFLSLKGRSFWRFLGILGLLISLFLIVILESRTVWLAAIAFVVVYGSSTLISKLIVKLKAKYWLIIFSAFILSTLMAFVIIKQKQEGGLRKAQELKTSVNISSQEEKNFTVSERLLLWKATLNMVWDNGWGGVGAGNWKIQFPAYGSDIWRARQGMVQFQRPHNDFLWVLSELGILGLLSYLTIFILLIFSAFKSISNTALSKVERQFIRLLLAGLVAYLVVAFFSFPRERLFHQIVLYLGIAFILSYGKKAELKTTFAFPLKTLTAIIGLLGLTFGLNWWQGERLSLKINQARTEGNWAALLAYADELKGNKFYQIDPVSIPISFYRGLAHLNLQNYSQSKIDFEKAFRLHPNNIHVINNLANINLLQGEVDAAIKFYQKALEVSPKYLDGALNLMSAYYNVGRIQDAYDFLLKYEPIFAVDRPDHPSLGAYRKAIVMAQLRFITEPMSLQRQEYWLSLPEEQILIFYDEARKQKISLEEKLEQASLSFYF